MIRLADRGIRVLGLSLGWLLVAGCVNTDSTSSSASTLDKYFGGPADTVTSFVNGRPNFNTGIDLGAGGASHTTGSNANSDLFWNGGAYLTTPNRADGIRYLGAGLSSTAFADVAGAYTSSATISLGGVYGVKTVEGNYAQVYVKGLVSGSNFTYDYAYQANGGTTFK